MWNLIHNWTVLKMFLYLILIGVSLSWSHCFSNFTKLQQDLSLVTYNNGTNKIEDFNQFNHQILCHCRFDFATVYFDAVEPFVTFAKNNSGNPCLHDKTCYGAVCVTVLSNVDKNWGKKNRAWSFLYLRKSFGSEENLAEKFWLGSLQSKSVLQKCCRPKLY